MAVGEVENKGLGTVSEGTGGTGTRVLRKDYPVEEGLIAGSTKQVGNHALEAEETLEGL